MKFRIRRHTLLPDREVVEVVDDKGKQIATVTPGDDGRSIRVLSHLMAREDPDTPRLNIDMRHSIAGHPIGVVEVVIEEGEGL